MQKRLLIALMAATAVAPRAHSSVLESLHATVVSRWDFQARYPLAAKLFDNQSNETDRMALIAQLRPIATTDTTSIAVSPAQENPSPAAMATLWTDFALGVAEEKMRPGEGEAYLSAASALARGNLSVNYELSRLMDQQGMYQRAHNWQLEAHRNMLEKGYVRIPDFAKLELRRARAAMDDGKYQVARQALEMAGRFDPMCPWVAWQSLMLHLREHSFVGLDLGVSWNLLEDALHQLRYYDTQSLFLINLSRSLRVGLGIFGAAGMLILFGRHFQRIAHPWAEKLPQVVELRVRYLAIALVPLSLVIGGAGYALLGLLGAMLLWKHCSAEEKSVLKAVMMGLALIPFLVMWERTMCRHLDARLGVNVYHLAWSRGYERPLEERSLSFPAHTHEDSVYRALALSIEYKKQGNYLRAADYAREAARLEPGGAFPLLNIGNLDMAAFDYQKAAEVFGRARRDFPNLTETWFNSSQAELYNNNSGNHKKYLDEAAELDAQWVTQWLKDNDENFPVYPATRKSMDPMLRTGQAWWASWRALVDLEFLNVTLHAGILDIQGSWLLVAVVLASIGLFFRFRGYSRHTHGWDLFECKICGRIMCRTCRKGVHCQTCFKTVSGVQDNRIKIELVARLRNRAALALVRTGATLNSLFPGTGHLYLGRGMGRYAWPLAASLLIGGLYGVNHMLMEYPAFVLGPLRWLLAVPLLLLYGAFNLKQLRTPIDLSAAAPTGSREKEYAR